MGFTVKPVSISCQSTLSTTGDDWGPHDGVRLYCLVTTSGGFIEALISGREFPPPDANDTYYFDPGITLDLASFPPQGSTSWDSPDIQFGEADLLTVALIGLNFGVPSVGGGGGDPFRGPTGAGIYEAQKSLANKLSDLADKSVEKTGSTAAGVISDGIFEALKDFIAALNSSADCKGVVFALGRTFDRKTLLLYTLDNTSFAFDPPIDEAGVATTLPVKQGCGNPNYSVRVLVSRTFSLEIWSSSAVTSSLRLSNEIPVEATNARCAPAKPNPKGGVGVRIGQPPPALMYKWVEGFDRQFTFSSSIWFDECHPFWTVDGQPLLRDSGSIKVRTATTHYPGERGVRAASVARRGGTDDLSFIDAVRDVTIDYQLGVPNTDGSRQLQLNTHGEDGNYELNVGLTFDFTGSYVDGSIPVGQKEIATTIVSVEGQALSGNDAFNKYKLCIFLTWYELTHVYERVIGEFGLPSPPDPPPDWERLEAGLEVMTQALRDLLLSELGREGVGDGAAGVSAQSSTSGRTSTRSGASRKTKKSGM
jgi:hypothetical protein